MDRSMIVKIAGVSIIILVLLGIVVGQNGFISSVISDTMEFEEGEEQSDADIASNVSGDLYATDADGTRVDIPDTSKNPFSGFMIAGKEVSNLNLDMWWTSTGRGLNWDTFHLTGTIQVLYFEEALNKYLVEYEGSIDSIEPNVTLYATTLVLGVEICKAGHISEWNDWDLIIKITVTASVNDNLGLNLSDSLSFQGGLVVLWDAAYSLTGGWEY